jgi:hypothetical protein
MTSGSYADHEDPGYLLARVRPLSVRQKTMGNILDWIDVGQVSAERDDLLSNYFYDNGVLRSIVDSQSAFLVLGRKGAGKTAVFRYFAENPREFIDSEDILVSLSFEDYNWRVHSLLATPESAESLAYKQSWRFVILVEAVKAYGQRFEEAGEKPPKQLREALKLLEVLFDRPVPKLTEIIGRKLLSLAKLKLPKGGLDLEQGGLDAVEISGGELSFEEVSSNNGLKEHLSHNIENLIAYLQKALLDGELPGRIFICFDRIDEAWDEVSITSSRLVIAGLVSAADSLVARYKGKVRPVIFIREDIFDELNLNDSNKLREDCGSLLYWTKDALDKMILVRLNYFANEAGVESITDLNALFDKEEMRQRTRPMNYVLKRSMMRPRDLICYLKRLISSMRDAVNDPFEDSVNEFHLLSAELLYEAEPGYSDWLKQEILDEWAVQRPSIKEVLAVIQNLGSTNLNREELYSALEQAGVATTQTDKLSELRFLFDNSIIGFRVGSSTQWRFKCFQPAQGFIDSEDYRVHDGIVRALNLTESRERK